MAVFPESMNKLDLNDTKGSLARLENYINYMGERIEFAMTNMTRNVSDAGVSTVEVLLLLSDMSKDIAVLSTTVNGMVGDINSTNSKMETMQKSMTTMQSNITTIGENVATIQNDITTLQGDVAALAEKVAALEAGNGG